MTMNFVATPQPVNDYPVHARTRMNTTGKRIISGAKISYSEQKKRAN
jgi:hypothetical protein